MPTNLDTYLMAKLPEPPGRKLVNRLSTRTKWLIMSPLGLLLVGAGLCVLSEAGHAKHTGAQWQQWFWWGVYGLILVNGGLSVFGQAVRYRVQLDYRRFVRRELKKRDRDRHKRKTSPGKGEV